MMYLHEVSRIAQADHLRQFIHWSTDNHEPKIESQYERTAVYAF